MRYTEIMYIGLREKKRFAIFSILGFIALILVVLFLYSNRKESSEPENVILSNVWENSVTVTWTTKIRTKGYLSLYKDSEKIGDFQDARGLGKSYTHYIDLSGLEPNTEYEFVISSAGVERLNQDGERFEFSTRELLLQDRTPNIVNGTVQGRDTLVFVMLDDFSLNYPLSTYVREQGEWSIDLSKFLPVGNSGDFVFRGDAAIKVLFYGSKGGEVFRGNKNVLFDDQGNFKKESLEITGLESIFPFISDVAKFKGIAVVPEREEIVEDDVLGIEIESESLEESKEEIIWQPLDN